MEGYNGVHTPGRDCLCKPEVLVVVQTRGMARIAKDVVKHNTVVEESIRPLADEERKRLQEFGAD